MVLCASFPVNTAAQLVAKCIDLLHQNEVSGMTGRSVALHAREDFEFDTATAPVRLRDIVTAPSMTWKHVIVIHHVRVSKYRYSSFTFLSRLNATSFLYGVTNIYYYYLIPIQITHGMIYCPRLMV